MLVLVSHRSTVCFAALNIPPVHHKMLDKRQAEIGLVVEAVAEESVKQSIEEEHKLTEE